VAEGCGGVTQWTLSTVSSSAPAASPHAARGAQNASFPPTVAPLPPSGSEVVVAQSYARIFFRNCISTGELYPVETDVRLCDELATGQDVTVDMEKDVLINHTTGKEYSLKPIGEVRGRGGGWVEKVAAWATTAAKRRPHSLTLHAPLP